MSDTALPVSKVPIFNDYSGYLIVQLNPDLMDPDVPTTGVGYTVESSIPHADNLVNMFADKNEEGGKNSKKLEEKPKKKYIKYHPFQRRGSLWWENTSDSSSAKERRRESPNTDKKP